MNCKKCNTKLNLEDVFCPECGIKVNLTSIKKNLISKSSKHKLIITLGGLFLIVVIFILAGINYYEHNLFNSQITTKNVNSEDINLPVNPTPQPVIVNPFVVGPTSDNPTAVSNTIEIIRNSDKNMGIGCYAGCENSGRGVTFSIPSCLKKDSTLVEIASLPTITSILHDVSQDGLSKCSTLSELILHENGLTAGIYICTLEVRCVANNYIKQVQESEQFFLQVK